MDTKEGEKAKLESSRKAFKKTRHASRPALSRVLINVMIDFLLQEDARPVPEDTPLWTEAWSELLKQDTELKIYARGISLKKRFLTWIRMLDIVSGEDGEPRLCSASTQKLLPYKEDIPKIIRDAHRMVGEFKSEDNKEDGAEEARSCKKGKHNSVEKVIKLIKNKYVFGGREFGIRKSAVYREILRCPECFEDGKLRIPGRELVQEGEMIDPDFGNEMKYISLKNAPVSFVLKGPSKSSVWYNQADLSNKQDAYGKLSGVINEVGVEVGKSTQNDGLSKERLITKLCCAEKLVNDMKEKVVEVFAYRIPTSNFLSDYEQLKEDYLTTNNTALYLQDMNFLMNTYKSFRNTPFINSVNDSLKTLVEKDDMLLQVVPISDGLALTGTSNTEKNTENGSMQNVTSAKGNSESLEPPGKIPRVSPQS